MLKKIIALAAIFMVIFSLGGCGNGDNGQSSGKTKKSGSDYTKRRTISKISVTHGKITAKLPKGLKWITNNTDPVFSSPHAVKGGTLHSAILNFPMTFRTVGPDSNGSFRSAILDNQLSLINIHPDTGRIIPELATAWAFGSDKKTMYFKLNKKARWSDGVPVTAWDFAYTLKFMRSSHIMAPWYNNYYTKEIDKVIVYDDYTLAVKSTKAQPDLYLKLGIAPCPEHYFGKIDKDFVQKYNWKIVPNTGAYQMTNFEKGRYIVFKRKKQWWGRNLRYFKNRFNVDRVVFKVIRDYNMLWEYFKKGKIDVFSLTMPKYWYNRSNTGVFNKGYVKKIWFFNDTPRSATGMWLNLDRPIFRDKRVRYAFAHAMNIKKVIDDVLRGDYYRLNQAYVGYGDYTDSSIRPRKFDIDKVESLMKAAGWKRGDDGIWRKNGKRFSVEVTYGFEGYTPRLVVLKEEAKKAGIELRLQKLDSTAAFKKFLEKKFDVAWMGWSTNIRPSYWQCWHSDNAHKVQTNNITNTDNPELDKLIDRYRASLDENQRKVLSRKIQDKIHEIGAFVPTFMVPYVRYGYWRWIRLPKFHGTKLSDSLFDPFNSMTGGLFWFDKKNYNETIQAMKTGKTFKPVTIIDKHFKPAGLSE